MKKINDEELQDKEIINCLSDEKEDQNSHMTSAEKMLRDDRIYHLQSEIDDEDIRVTALACDIEQAEEKISFLDTMISGHDALLGAVTNRINSYASDIAKLQRNERRMKITAAIVFGIQTAATIAYFCVHDRLAAGGRKMRGKGV